MNELMLTIFVVLINVILGVRIFVTCGKVCKYIDKKGR